MLVGYSVQTFRFKDRNVPRPRAPAGTRYTWRGAVRPPRGVSDVVGECGGGAGSDARRDMHFIFDVLFSPRVDRRAIRVGTRRRFERKGVGKPEAMSNQHAGRVEGHNVSRQGKYNVYGHGEIGTHSRWARKRPSHEAPPLI